MNLYCVDEIYLPVTNLERSTRWVSTNFGLQCVRTESPHVRQATLAFPPNQFVVVESPVLNRYTHIPFNFHTNRLDHWHTHLRLRGVTVTALVKDDGMLCCDFFDPDGNRIGLVEEPRAGVPDPYIEVGGTFLAVRDIDKAVEWYRQAFGFQFAFFSSTESAGYAGPTPEYVPGLTIRYATVRRGGLKEPAWTRLALVQTPEFYPLVHLPYSIRSENAEADYITLKSRGVTLSAFHDQPHRAWFDYSDLDGNVVRVVEYCSGNDRSD